MRTVRAGIISIGNIALGAGLAFTAALLFPVLVTAREQTPLVSCQANLKEIGTAITMYMEDYDGFAPLARSVEIDARPLVREGAAGESPFVLTGGLALLSSQLGNCPPLGRPGLWPLHLVLDCYVSRPNVWRDPEDHGDQHRGPAAGTASQSGTSTVYARYGSSYQYNQTLVWRMEGTSGGSDERRQPVGQLDPVSCLEIVRPDQVPLAFDGQGTWHGAALVRHTSESEDSLPGTVSRGYNVVFADGRARFVPSDVLLNRSSSQPTGLLYRDPRR
jgi:hypothetical protein